ncbi:coiled-coil domain-containing protein 77 [Dunckerocampus dactyliophorus]|uniref:coiled-coil domain-containing protein 77 n=1 Tax=Dunckerocampus dactyliophorus TaxID=161453 RepID=UPI0024065DFD|nr:coiled-coil domain-containing protein 77 [Dunckerocampus dactyliophorus]
MESAKKHAVPHSVHTPGKELESRLPPINERLAYLRPSRELLEFYRDKISQFDGEHDQLLKMLEKYKSTIENQHKLQGEVRQREGEIAELQNALSDMQVYLYQEREQSLRLHAENDRLKIRELEDRKKIQHLLSMVGHDDGEVTYFFREPPHKVTVKQKQLESEEENLNLRPTRLRPVVTSKETIKRAKVADPGAGDALEKYKNDNNTLILQVEALQAQLEEQTRLAKERVQSLQEDRQIKTEEARAERQRDEQRISALTEKLQRTQNLLYESTKDFLQLKFDTRAQEKRWLTEKDCLLGELDTCHERQRKAGYAGAHGGRPQQPGSSSHTQADLSGAAAAATGVSSGQAAVATAVSPSRPAASTGITSTRVRLQPQPDLKQKHKEDIKAMHADVKQAQRMAEMYREQCVALESELAQAREEGDIGREIFKERSDKMTKRLQLMTQRYEALERRRALEVEGFKTDLKQLRQKLKDVEKQLLQVTLNVGPNQDLAILHEVRESNTRTKKVQSELMALKAKIYGLENELRFC